jgi:hypothetical protein
MDDCFWPKGSFSNIWKKLMADEPATQISKVETEGTRVTFLAHPKLSNPAIFASHPMHVSPRKCAITSSSSWGYRKGPLGWMAGAV